MKGATMKDYIEKRKCHIHSLSGELQEATIIRKTADNVYLAEYNGVKCTAIFNPFVGTYFVDDMFGTIPEPSTKDHIR